ncbi:putative membrane protein [Halorhabdus sp. SVX81]|uniref:hypothetical protein n=1 Tax=Halorhabdus sp. SVX81 TaxID=2978283 RepID=UPI0023DC1FBC|nr:hypothetical protein [Halorhabdus sp. SVX81]WEL16854.1 putative membrane protein [Halorhabdus sp. SVX81]
MNRERTADIRERISALGREVRHRAVPVLFGDRVGLTLFLGVIASLAALWRVGFFITDTYAIANTVINLSEGRLNIAHIEYSLTLGSQPGLYRHGGQVFGRNYGQAALALPFYWLLEGASVIAELRLVLAGAWSLLVAGFASQLGRVLDRSRVTLVGTLLALGLFVANVRLSTPLDPRWNGLLALQLLSLLAAGVVAVAIYRLGCEFHGRRVGLAGGLLAALALPIAFWATIPKRHVMSAALIAVVVFAFGRSRNADQTLPSRALAYAAVGVLAWLHAAEALVVLVVLVPFDLVTAQRNGVRELMAVGAVFVLSLLPFGLTNLLITGSPFTPPRMLWKVGNIAELGPGGDVIVDTGGESAPTPEGTTTPAETTTPGAPGDTQAPGPGMWSRITGLLGGAIGLVAGVVSTTIGFLNAVLTAVIVGVEVTIARLGELWGYATEGINIVFGDIGRFSHVILRSGHIPEVQYGINDQEAIELTVLEVAPMLGTLIAIPIVLGKRGLESGRERLPEQLAAIRSTPRYQTDLFAGTLVIAFTLLFLPQLPLYSQITMRYLVPIMPVAIYGVMRLPAVRRSLRTDFREFLGAYLGTAVIGVAGVTVAFVALDPAIGEAMQFHALLNLAVAGVVALVVVVDTVLDRDLPVGTAIGAAGGAGTTLYVLAGIEYFTYGEFALPVTEWLSAVIPLF